MGDGVVLPCVACRKEGEGPARTYPLHTLIEHVARKHAGLSPLLRCSECSFRCVSTLSALAHATSCGGHVTLSEPIGAYLFSDGESELALKTARMEIIIKESLHKHVKGEIRVARKQERERIEEERKREKKEQEKRERQKRRRSRSRTRSRSRDDREKRRKADERFEEWTNEEIQILFVHMRSPPLNDSAATGDRRIKDEPVDDYEYGCVAKEEALPTPTPTPPPLVDYTQMQPPKRFHINPSLLKKKKKRKSTVAPAPAPAPSPPAHSPPAPSPLIHVDQERLSAASRPSGRLISRWE